MKKWILDLLKCNKTEIRISKNDRYTGEPFSGIVICNGRRYYIRKGILLLISKEYLKMVSQIKGLYEALPEAPWKAFKNEWIRHMRLIHLEMLYDALN